MGKGHLLAIGSANEKQEQKSNRGREGTLSEKMKVGPGGSTNKYPYIYGINVLFKYRITT